MRTPANVRSLDAIRNFRVSLARFRQRVDDSLTLLAGEMRRTLDWLEHDCPREWQRAAHRASDDVVAAKLDLERCLMFPVADERPACREQRAALQKAQQRLAQCREKIEIVRQAAQEVRHEMIQYQGRVAQLSQLVETDVPQAGAMLDRIVDDILRYQSVRAESDRLPPAADASAEPNGSSPLPDA